MSIYTDIKDAIEVLVPEGWKFTGYEPNAADLPEVTGLTLKLRSVTRPPGAPLGAYRTDWVLTVTSGLTSRESSDPGLADDLIEFLLILDETPGLSWMAWENATKVIGDDNDRLAYDINLYTLTKKEA